MPLLSLLRRKLPPRALRALGIISVIAAIAAVFWICTYKIMDRDFWWHITAGRIMLQTHDIIRTDPFAYTRAGLPYLATHEWLAQIVLFLVYKITGSTGIILLRGIVATGTISLLLMLAKKLRVAYLLLGTWAVVITKGSWLERPQLFTFVLFSAFLFLAFRYLDAESMRARVRICLAAIVLELLWVNMHGAAALLGCAIVTFCLLQTWMDTPRHIGSWKEMHAVILLGCALVAMALVLILPPNGFGTFRYLLSLLNDQTILYSAEWHPRDWLPYLFDLWPFWLGAIAAIVVGRRHVTFNILVLFMAAYLSRQAVRNEIFFVLTSFATCCYQWERGERSARIMRWLGEGRVVVVAASLLAVLLMGNIAYARSVAFERGDNLFGFGQFDLARGASDFLEHEGIAGNMFNTYGIGGYLIYRGYPTRKVFIDGRNVDYGMDYLTHAYAAGVSLEEWNALVQRYNIAYAVIDYDAIRQKDRLPYSSILDGNPQWSLVYLDDWTAVYLKATQSNQPIIDALRYRLVTATNLQFDSGFSDIKDSALPELVAELQRVREGNPDGVKATLALAKVDLRIGRIDDATSLANEALHKRPFSPEPYEILGAAYVGESKWDLAADAYGRLLASAGGNYPDINYGFIANVYEKAGHPWAAWLLRLRTHTATAPAPKNVSSTGSVSVGTGRSLPVSPARDAMTFNDAGVTQAESKQYSDAEKSFLNAIKLNPSYAEAWNNLCALRLTIGRYSDAIDSCKRAIKEHDAYADAHFNLALAYYHNGSKQNAESEAERAGQLGRRKESDELLLLIRKMHL